jgi:pyruvate dehydrogenase E2 component (dihydrolipoamide acetyltransferase)
LTFLERLKKQTGRPVTMTHFVVKAFAHVLESFPEANAIIRWNRLYYRKDISAFVQVSIPNRDFGSIDLTGHCIRGLAHKGLVDVADELNGAVSALRKQEDPSLRQARETISRIPSLLLFPFVQLLAFFTFTLNRRLPGFGLDKDPMGSFLVADVGSLGVDTAYVPLAPYTRVPLTLVIGAVRKSVVAVGDEPRVMKTIALHCSIDHRALDGFQIARINRLMRKIFEKPEEYLGGPCIAEVGTDA